MTTSTRERRITSRLACHISVRYNSGPSWHPATVVDLSRHGCRLRIGEDLARGLPVVLTFERTTKDQETLQVEVPGKVIWSRLEGLSHQAGVQFTGAAEQVERILDSF